MTERGSSYEGTPPPSAKGAAGERRVALVIGNANYASECDALTNPHNDARGIAAVLTRIGFTGVKANVEDEFTVDFSAIGVEPLLDLTNQRLGRALAAVTRVASSASQAVVYYAGHGIELHGENYLIPIDARLAHIADAEYETQALSRALRAIQGASGLQLVILDACRNNPFRGRLFGTRDLGGGLRSIEPPGNVLVAYAAKHGTTAWDGEKGGNSPFASALLKYIETPGLEVIDLFREVKDEVLEATNLGQEPHLYGSVGRRRDYFVAPGPSYEQTKPIATSKPFASPRNSGSDQLLASSSRPILPKFLTQVDYFGPRQPPPKVGESWEVLNLPNKVQKRWKIGHGGMDRRPSMAMWLAQRSKCELCIRSSDHIVFLGLPDISYSERRTSDIFLFMNSVFGKKSEVDKVALRGTTSMSRSTSDNVLVSDGNNIVDLPSRRVVSHLGSDYDSDVLSHRHSSVALPPRSYVAHLYRSSLRLFKSNPVTLCAETALEQEYRCWDEARLHWSPGLRYLAYHHPGEFHSQNLPCFALDFRDGVERLTQIDSSVIYGNHYVHALVWHPSREILAYSGHDPDNNCFVLCTFDFDEQKRTVMRVSHSDSAHSVDWSPSGQFIVTASHDRSVVVHNITTGSEVLLFDHSKPVRLAKFSPDGQRLVTFSNGLVVVSNPSNGDKLASWPTTYDSRAFVETVWSPHADMIVSVMDGALQVHRLRV